VRPYRYEQPSFGEFGRVEEVDGKLVCHLCGRLYRGLNVHVLQAHGMPATEYRETFRLNVGYGLVSSPLKRRMGENARRNLPKKFLEHAGKVPRDRALAGAKTPPSDQWRINHGEAARRRRGVPLSDEQRVRQSETMLARSDELSERTRQQWAARSPEERSRITRIARAAQPRKTHCRLGHELAGDNRTVDGKCRTCHNARAMRRYFADHDARKARRREKYHLRTHASVVT
jgi:hypothetical protein